MLFAIGFLVTFLLGGLTGILLASPPVDFHVHADTTDRDSDPRWRTGEQPRDDH